MAPRAGHPTPGDRLVHQRGGDTPTPRLGLDRDPIDGDPLGDILQVHEALADRLPIDVRHEPKPRVVVSGPVAVEPLDHVPLVLWHGPVRPDQFLVVVQAARVCAGQVDLPEFRVGPVRLGLPPVQVEIHAPGVLDKGRARGWQVVGQGRAVGRTAARST